MKEWQKRIALVGGVASLLGTLVWFTLSRRALPLGEDIDDDAGDDA